MTQRIVISINPKRIILFGSYARGDMHAGSDLDLCIITETNEDWFERRLTFKRKLRLKNFNLEAHIYTVKEWEMMLSEEHRFALQIQNEGKVLYEQK